MATSKFIIYFFVGIFDLGVRPALALPAFAMREKVSCTLCHTNGSAPHLTETGFLYRRAGFRFPQNIGNKALDDENMDVLKHFVAGINVDYEAVTNKPQGGSESLVQNNFDVREVEFYPVVGAFLGNYAAWSEIDASPTSVPATPGGTSAPTAGAVNLNEAELRYVDGDKDFYYGIRAGLIAPEGYGASDQWPDDGALPLVDSLSAVNIATGIDTLALPLGANNVPQLGAEIMASWTKTYLTLGIYNGFDGTNGYATNLANSVNAGYQATPSTLNVAQMNAQGKGSKDVKLQLDQMLGKFAITAVYYNGRIALLDSSGLVPWQENYQMGRLYGSYFVIPNRVDLMAGAGAGQFGFVQSGASTIAGHFNNVGTFLGGNYYVMPHLTLSARVDYYQYDTTASPRPIAQSATLLASLPYENNLFIFHFIRTEDVFAGLTNDFRAEWRFLY